MTAAIIAEAWERAITLFHKRYLIAHKLGVADQEYVDRSGDRDAATGRKIRVRSNEVTELSNTLRTAAKSLVAQFTDLGTGT